MTSLLFAILLAQAGGDSLEDLVRDLGHDSIEVRERAHGRLLAAGSPAIPALRTALASTDAEVRIRASIVLEVVERTRREGPHDANQLKLLLFMRQNLEAEKRPGSGATQGARFDLGATPFDGGWIVSTQATNYLARRSDEGPGRGRLQFDIRSISGADGRDLAVERCGLCSPAKVYVKAPAGPMKVRLTGRQVWFSPYELEFRNPFEGQRKRVGDFTIEVAWPSLRVTSEREFPDAWLPSMVGSYKCTQKKGIGIHAEDIGTGIG